MLRALCWNQNKFLGVAVVPRGDRRFFRMDHQPKRREDKTFQETLDLLYSMQSNQTTIDLWEKDRRANKDLSTEKFGKMKECVKHIGVGDKDLNVLHITGTKGKGSTSAFLDSILRHRGYRTGLFTSPHLVSVTERIRINGIPLSKEQFVDYFWDIRDSLLKLDICFGSPQAPIIPYFYFLTLMGLKVFVSERVDVAILEVGIGGRYDATNIFPSSVASAITLLDLDHMNVLGDTLTEIASQKAGIMKAQILTKNSEGAPAFVHFQKDEVIKVFQDEAKKVGAKELLFVEPLDEKLFGARHLGIEGVHQLGNAALAVQLASTWEQFKGKEGVKRGEVRGDSYRILPSPPELPASYTEALCQTRWPGRSHHCQSALLPNTEIFIDGSHTPLSVQASVLWMKKKRAEIMARDPNLQTYTILLFGCGKSRHPANLLSCIHESAIDLDIRHLLLTTISLHGTEEGKVARESDWGHVELMEKGWNEFPQNQSPQQIEKYQNISDAVKALHRIRQTLPPETQMQVLVIGSLYVAGGVLGLLDIPAV